MEDNEDFYGLFYNENDTSDAEEAYLDALNELSGVGNNFPSSLWGRNGIRTLTRMMSNTPVH